MNLNINDLIKNYSLQIFNYYLKPFNQHQQIRQGKNISNPFLKEKQKTPSFNIFYAKRKHTWLYYDFATGDRGNCIELVKQLFNLSFKDAVVKILKDFPELANTIADPIRNASEHKIISPVHQNEMPLKREFSINELEYWKSYGISLETLKFYGVFSLSEIPGSKLKSSESPFFPVFGYPYENSLKIYMPYSTKNRFFFKGEKPENFYFGLKQLPENGDYVIITGGEKDVMSLKAHGFNSICLNSETAIPTDSLIKQLKEKFDHVIILYDNDETGRKRSIELAQKFSLIRIELPAKEGLKDISDFFKAKYSANELESLINEAVKKTEPRNPKEKTAPWSNIANSPLISETVYENLPVFLQEICLVQKDKRSMDVALISALATLSGCFPNVSGVYGGRTFYTNLYCFVIAPAASGKGNLGLIRHLAEEVHKSIVDQSKELFILYKEQMKLYRKNLKETGDMPEPIKPDFKILLIPANTSHAAMVEQLFQNGGRGIISDTEADAVGNAFKQDWGNYSETLRKSWHHEAVNNLRKLDMKYVEVETPQLSVVLSGTPNQTIAIIKSAEDGLLSRFIYYVFTNDPVWLDVSPAGNQTNLTEHYKRCGKKVKEIHDYFLLNPTTIELSVAQWEQLNKFGDQSIKDVQTFLTEEALSIPKRLGIVLFRLAMILTCLRGFESNSKSATLFCSDSDFEIALSLCEVFLDHAKLVYVNLPAVQHSNLDPFKQKFYNLLPDDLFNCQLAYKLGLTLGIKDRAVRDYLKMLVKGGLLETGKLGNYKKIGIPSLPSLPNPNSA